MPETSDFGAWVRERLAGQNYRDAAEEIGLHFTTLYDLAKGRTKSRETVIRFARGVGAPVNEALEKAGMEPERTSAAEQLLEGLRQLAVEFGRDEVPVSFSGGLASVQDLTPEEVDRLLASIRRRLAEEAAEEAPP